jgi:prepilin-type N-terminal cleavage/methylation domain-containing protein
MKNKGFNIIELIVVISIIGLLSAVGVFSYRGLFKRSQLERTMNEIRGFYEGVNRGAVTEGYKYILQLDRENESFKYIGSNSGKKDSLILEENLDLDFPGEDNPIRLIVHVDGFVNDVDTVRDFSVVDNETGNSISFYISPLGAMEVSIQ